MTTATATASSTRPGRGRPALWYIARLAAVRPGLFLTCAALVTFTYIAPLVPPLIASALVDRLSGHAQAGLNIATLIVAWLAWGFVNASAHVMQNIQETTQQVIAGLLIRRNVLADMLGEPAALTLPVPVGDALTRFRSDVDSITETLMWSYDPIGQGLTTVFALVVMASVNPDMTAFVVLPLFLVVAAVNVARRRITRFRRLRQEATGAVTGLVSETFSAVVPIKIAVAEQRAAARLTELNRRRRDAALRDVLLTQVLASISRNMANLSSGVILLVLAAQMRAGSFTAGDFVLFSSYMAFVSLLISNFGEVLTKLRQTTVSTQRLLEVVPGNTPEALVRRDAPHPADDSPSGRQPLVTLTATGLTYRFAGSGGGVSDVSLRLDRGSFTVVTGRIGAGKTTLLRVLTGLLPAQSGVIAWNGRPVADSAAFLIPPRCAYTPQVPKLVSAALRDNILLGLPAAQDDVDAAIWAAVLDRDISELEDGLDTVVGSRGIKLSGGQVQRAAAARMFVRHADLLVIDDLSSALDAQTESLLWQRLMTDTDTTYLVVSHRSAALRRADTVILLDAGQVADSGSLDELLERSTLMRDLWDGSP